MAGVSDFAKIDLYSLVRPPSMNPQAFLDRIILPVVASRGLGPLTTEVLREIGLLYNRQLKEMALTSEGKPASLNWPQQKAYLKRISSTLDGAAARMGRALIEQTERDWDESPDEEMILTAQKKMGRIVFLNEKFPDLFMTDIDDPSMSEEEMVNALFSREINHLVKRVRDTWYQHETFSIQEATPAFSFELARTIARALITKEGLLNLGLIQDLKEAFFHPQSNRSYEIGMKRVLEAMDASWQAELDAVQKPLDDQIHSERLIRSELGLSPDQRIEDIHAKQVVIGALLSQFCQGAIGEAFSVACEIHRTGSYLKQAIRDYGRLAREGSLIRIVEGKPQRFFFKAILSDAALDWKFVIDRKGNLKNGKPFWGAPGIQAALLQMGIRKIDEQRVLARLLNGKEKGETSAREAIRAIGRETQEPDVEEIGWYAFSVANNRMLRAAETALASMAEGRGGYSIRDRLIQSVQIALTPLWKQLKQNRPLLETEEIHQLQRRFQSTLMDKIRYVYSTSIGFELYEKNPNNPLSPGRRIGTLAEFQKMIGRAAELGKKMESVQEFIHSPQFRSMVLAHYDKTYRTTPLTDWDGKESFVLDAVDGGLPFLPRFQRLQPKSAYDFMNELLKYGASFYATKRKWPEWELIFDPDHDFYLNLHELREFALSGYTSDQWLMEKLIAPSQRFADQRIDPLTKEAILRSFLLNLSPPMMSEEGHGNLARSLTEFQREILKREESFSEYVLALADMAIHFLDLDDDEVDEVYDFFDYAVYDAMPPEEVKNFLQTSILFAKVFLEDQESYFYYCAYYHVRTRAVAIGRVDPEKTKIYPVSEGEWADIEDFHFEENDSYSPLEETSSEGDELP